MRLIQEATDAIQKTLTNRHPSRVSENLQILDGALDEALNVNRSMVDYVDTKTLAHLLREPERIRAVAMLLAAKGDVVHDQDAAGAVRYRSRALELYLTIMEKASTSDLEAIETLAALIPREAVSPEALSVLDSLT